MRKVLQQLLFTSALLSLLISCEKGTEPFPPPVSAEKTVVSLVNGGSIRVLALDIAGGFESTEIVEVKRDCPTQADLMKTQVVKIIRDKSALSELGGTVVTEIPESAYNIDPEFPFDGQAWTLTFQPGEFVKSLKINLNRSALASYGRVGFGFRISEAPGAQISGDLKISAVEIGAKNAYDGVYRVTWTNYHPTANPTYSGSSTEIEMRTSGPSSVKLYWPLAGAFCTPSILNGGLSYFLAQEPEYRVGVGNVLTVQNVAPGATTFYTMATGFNSRYEPATKTFYAKWGYGYGAGGTFDPANTREWTQTIVYLRPR